MSWTWRTANPGLPTEAFIRLCNQRFKALENLLQSTLGAIGTATDGDATPSVLGLGVLVTANTGATTITALDGGIPRQRLLVRFGDGNTTLEHSATLDLDGDVDIVGADGGVVALFTEDGTTWREYPQA